MPQQTSFPGPYQPAIEDNRHFTETWFNLLLRLWRRTGGSGGEIPAETITPDGSPFSHESDLRGAVVVQGGTVSEIAVVRGDDTVVTGQTAGMIPVMPGDVVRVTYSAAPAMTFLPSEISD